MKDVHLEDFGEPARAERGGEGPLKVGPMKLVLAPHAMEPGEGHRVFEDQALIGLGLAGDRRAQRFGERCGTSRVALVEPGVGEGAHEMMVIAVKPDPAVEAGHERREAALGGSEVAAHDIAPGTQPLELIAKPGRCPLRRLGRGDHLGETTLEKADLLPADIGERGVLEAPRHQPGALGKAAGKIGTAAEQLPAGEIGQGDRVGEIAGAEALAEPAEAVVEGLELVMASNSREAPWGSWSR